MTGKKITTNTIKSNYGFGDASEQAVKSILGKTEEEKEVTSISEVQKKRGRKKLENREKKSRYSFTILPSIYEQSQKKAEQEGKSLSELVSTFLIDYIN